MEFEWDETKRRSNLHKHGVDILRAALIFRSTTLTFEDDRADYGEQRFRSIGFAGDECYVVVWTWRTSRRRLISAWKGGRREREEYQTRHPR